MTDTKNIYMLNNYLEDELQQPFVFVVNNTYTIATLQLPQNKQKNLL